MDLTSYTTVGTQTPTEDRCFEFPECFTPSPQMSRSSVSSIGTQTGVRTRTRSSFEFPDSGIRADGHRPKLFRRHSTGSDVYNFSNSPTLLTAFGGILSRRLFAEENGSYSGNSFRHQNKGDLLEFEDTNEDVEKVGQQLRKIGDDLDRGGSFRNRSVSVSRFFMNVRRRTSSSSS